MRSWGTALVATVWLWAPDVAAHSGGAPGGGCTGCHGGGEHDVAGASMPGSISPGQQVTITLSVLSASGNEAGIFIDADAGAFETISGQGLAEVPAGLTHVTPKSISGGSADFSFRWTPPNAAGAVRFVVSSVVANGNGSSSGDGGAEHNVDFVYGCSSQVYYRDHDGDGFGRDGEPRLFCAGDPDSGYAADGGDCDDNREGVFPGAVEYCNLLDDDCDGTVDEDALPLLQYPDADGDGYYGYEEGQSEETYLGCVPTDGWAAERGDCQPENPDVNPGVEEICNGIDDNCDGRSDEWVRPRCGEGWCRREADNCDPDSCVPGEPRPEECNLFDDDCDGELDEGSCPEGQTCVAAECVEDDEAAGTDESGESPHDDGTTGTGGGTGETPDAPAADGEARGCSVGAPAPGPALWLLLLLAVPRRRGAMRYRRSSSH